MARTESLYLGGNPKVQNIIGKKNIFPSDIDVNLQCKAVLMRRTINMYFINGIKFKVSITKNIKRK